MANRRRLLSKVSEAAPGQDITMADGQPAGAENTPPSIADSPDNPVSDNNRTLSIHERSRVSDRNPSADASRAAYEPIHRQQGNTATAASPPLTAQGNVACQTCQRCKIKCFGQSDHQPLQYNLVCDFCADNEFDRTWSAPQRTPGQTQARRRPTTAGSSQSASNTPPGQIKTACVECRRRKQKCTGERPTCAFCAGKVIECNYEVADGRTRTEDLKFKVREAIDQAGRLSRAVGAMQQGTKEQSSALLARLRSGASIEELLDPAAHPNFPDFIRGGRSPGSSWPGLAAEEEEEEEEDLSTQTSDTQPTPSTASSYSLPFAASPPQLSPADIDQANETFKRGFLS